MNELKYFSKHRYSKANL